LLQHLDRSDWLWEIRTVNSVLVLSGSTRPGAATAAPITAAPTRRSAGGRRAMPTWLHRAVDTNSERALATRVGFRIGG
jgi:hypothetical protein